jgi:hypothetical protein
LFVQEVKQEQEKKEQNQEDDDSTKNLTKNNKNNKRRNFFSRGILPSVSKKPDFLFSKKKKKFKTKARGIFSSRSKLPTSIDEESSTTSDSS